MCERLLTQKPTACVIASCLLKASRPSSFNAKQDAFLTSPQPVLWGSVLSEAYDLGLQGFLLCPLHVLCNDLNSLPCWCPKNKVEELPF